jgi:hypothetical protein
MRDGHQVLDDAVRRELDRRGQRARIAGDGQPGVRSRVPGQEGVEMSDGGCRSERHVATSQEPDDLPHAVEGRATVALDRLEQGLGPDRVEVRARVRSGGELAEPLLQEPVELVRQLGAVTRDLEGDPLVPQLLELPRASHELCAQGRAVPDGPADAEDDQHDR